jgi:ATP-dependent Clp protease adaptor protein ClpS
MTSKGTKRNPEYSPENDSGGDQFLTIYNDDEHTFDFVIEALIDICGHEYMQAAQCTIIAHYKGSCDVRKGTRKNLAPQMEALLERGLYASIN